MPSLDPHYHVGIIVADLPSARARLTDLLGVQWGPVMHLDQNAYRDGAGVDHDLPTTICYSSGQPSIELIQEAPGTVWVRNEHSNLHHIGFWSDRFTGDSEDLVVAGCPLQLCGREGSHAPTTFAYHRDSDLGIRVEIVDAAMRDAMSFLFQPDPFEP